MSIIEKAMHKLANESGKKTTQSQKKPRRFAKKVAKRVAVNSAKKKFQAALSQNEPKSPMEEYLNDLGINLSSEQALRNDDEYRRIKRPLLANAKGKGVPEIQDGNLIMITSSLQDEGKTHTVINLALSIARERDNSVLILDADVSQAAVSRAFKVYGEPGLTELLLEEDISSDDVIKDTAVPNIKILPAGAVHTDTTELLASERMLSIVKQLSSEDASRIIIIDSPPLLLTPEPQVLASMAGQIVLVIEAVKTPKHVVEEAVEILDTNKPVNLVLNKANRSLNIGYYEPYHHSYTAQVNRDS